jgi:hypothetical protein
LRETADRRFAGSKPRPAFRPAHAREWAAALLDVIITAYAVALLVGAAGGLRLGWISMTGAAKPLLVLLIVVPIRVTLGPSPFARTTWLRSLATTLAATRRRFDRSPPALRDCAFAFAVTRLATLSIGFLANILFPADRIRPFTMPFEQRALAETFAAWDSGWYFDIALRGYYYVPDGQSSVAFFPLYPMLMRAFAWPFGLSEAAVWTAGIAISYAACFAGLVVVHRLTERLFDDRETARRTVLLMCVYPFSFFLTRVYPSALFFLLAALSVSAAYRSRWWIAGVCGALTTLTRPHGILIALPLGLLAMQHASWRSAAGRMLQLTPIPLAFAAYCAYVWSLSGDPLAWLNSQNQWGYSLGHPPWQQLLSVIGDIEAHGLYDYFFTSPEAAFRLFHAGAAFFLLATTPFVFQRLGSPLGCWVLASCVIPLTANALEGIGRYGAALFPVFMTVGAMRSARVHEALLIVWSLFLALFVGLFVTWHPIY